MTETERLISINSANLLANVENVNINQTMLENSIKTNLQVISLLTDILEVLKNERCE
jgi:hypothetical protein